MYNIANKSYFQPRETKVTLSIKVKILEAGDQVINVWSNQENTFIAVKKQNGEVYVHCVTPDENCIPRINNCASFIITYGEGEMKLLLKEK